MGDTTAGERAPLIAPVINEHLMGTRGATRVRLVHVSDTHGRHHRYAGTIPDGDILIHSGDFSQRVKANGLAEAASEFNEFLAPLPHAHKLLIAGNHEIAFNDLSKAAIQALLPHCIYLEDSSVRLLGLEFYGSPWTSSHRMGFSASHEELAQHWAAIPASTDVLITHLPPRCVLDLAYSESSPDVVCELCAKRHPQYRHWGSPALFTEVTTRIKPLVHLFGHVHECNGVLLEHGVLFSNASMDLIPRPIVIDIYLPPQQSPPSSPRSPSLSPRFISSAFAAITGGATSSAATVPTADTDISLSGSLTISGSLPLAHRWIFQREQIIHQETGFALTMASDELNVLLAPEEDPVSPNQCWIYARGRIQSKVNGLYLTVPSKKIGLQMNSYSFSRRQKWTYTQGGLLNRKYLRWLTASAATLELQIVPVQ